VGGVADDGYLREADQAAAEVSVDRNEHRELIVDFALGEFGVDRELAGSGSGLDGIFEAVPGELLFSP
jgi:hypothetical protein